MVKIQLFGWLLKNYLQNERVSKRLYSTMIWRNLELSNEFFCQSYQHQGFIRERVMAEVILIFPDNTLDRLVSSNTLEELKFFVQLKFGRRFEEIKFFCFFEGKKYEIVGDNSLANAVQDSFPFCLELTVEFVSIPISLDSGLASFTASENEELSLVKTEFDPFLVSLGSELVPLENDAESDESKEFQNFDSVSIPEALESGFPLEELQEVIKQDPLDSQINVKESFAFTVSENAETGYSYKLLVQTEERIVRHLNENLVKYTGRRKKIFSEASTTPTSSISVCLHNVEEKCCERHGELPFSIITPNGKPDVEYGRKLDVWVQFNCTPLTCYSVRENLFQLKVTLLEEGGESKDFFFNFFFKRGRSKKRLHSEI